MVWYFILHMGKFTFTFDWEHPCLLDDVLKMRHSESKFMRALIQGTAHILIPFYSHTKVNLV